MLTEKSFDTGTVALNYVEGPAAGPLPPMPNASLFWPDCSATLRRWSTSSAVSSSQSGQG